MRRRAGWITTRAGVRVRAAASAAIVVALALGVGGFVLVTLLDRSLYSIARSDAEITAGEVADALADGAEPRAAVGDLRSAITLVQVLGTDGSVSAASAPLTGKPALVAERPGVSEQIEVGPVTTNADPGSVVVAVAMGVATAQGDRIVVAAEPLRAVGRSVTTATELLLVIMPVLVAVSAAATYIAAARALRPVEAMRGELAAITDRDLDRRIAVPVMRDEIARLAETMNGTLDRLRGARESQRRFIADASHELRSPLTTIVANLQLLRPLAGQDGDRLRVMGEEADRLGQLIEDLLLLARADERGLRRKDDDVDLDEICFAERARLRSLGTVHASVEVEGIRLRGDPDQLTRAVRNLVDNAVRHCTGRIALRLYRQAGDAVVEIGDDGPGIAEEDRPRVVERFVRLDAGRARDEGGTGLGLAIVSEIAHAHGGTLTVGDSPLGGALFRMRLPDTPPD